MINRTTLVSVIALAAAAGTALGAAELIFVGDGLGITDLSQDGRVVVGNTIGDEAYETWRWVQGDPLGWKRLGRATVPVLGSGGGSPNVSLDGTRVSATILGGVASESRAEPYGTSGIWTLGLGWTELFPPLPPDCILLDHEYASAWGLSGNGEFLTGFYWRSTQGGTVGGAHPSISSIAGGNTGLPTANNRSARVNAANYDGTVVTGWEATITGPWNPMAWRDGVRYPLYTAEVTCTAEDVNGDGSIIVGCLYNVQAARRNAARWDWDGAQYVATDLGVLPGTPQTFIGYVCATSVTDDGSKIVGINRFSNNGPGSVVTGFLWTQEDGMRDIVDVMADEGVTLPGDYSVVAAEISPDGSAIGLMCRDDAAIGEFAYKAYVFRFTPLSTCAGDVNGDGVTNAADFTILAGSFGSGPGVGRSSGDLTGDGFVNVADFTVLAGDFGCAPQN